MKHTGSSLQRRFLPLAAVGALSIAPAFAAVSTPPLLLSGLSKKHLVASSLRAAAPVAASFDTLNIIAFMVEFKQDSSTYTTGTGLLGDMDEKDESRGYSTDTIYTYDDLPHDQSYLAQQLNFVADYYATVSRGHLALRYSIYPPAGDANFFRVPQTMPFYSPGGKKKKESWDEYYYRKTVGLMRFIKDAVAQFGVVPFEGLSRDSTTGIIYDAQGRKTVFLIMHAGSSYLTDGGVDGYFGQDTPSDMIDAFVSRDWFQYFRDTLGLSADGIYVRTGSDSMLLDEIMMIPETSNQDKLNWGIHGILVNQIARQLGIPDLWSTSSGISGVGAFCIMDFSGYSAGNGFIPPWPSAWVRLFMGWERPAIAMPGENRSFRLTAVSAADPATDTTMVMVPINDHEYFLLENRQRSLDGDLSVFNYDTSENKDTVFIAPYPYNVNIDSVVDSTSGQGPDLSNAILKVRNYDVSLPASGVVVWHVDENIIRDRIAYNMVNADSAYRGVALVEADGIGDLGIMFQDMLGQAAFDYGGAEDVFPHRSIRFKNGNFTVDSLGPFTRPSTMSNDRGHTYLSIRVPVPAGARAEKSAIRDYYVDNYAAATFDVQVSWTTPPAPAPAAQEALQPTPLPGWPRRMAADSAFLEPVLCDLARGDRYRELAVVTSSGRLYLWPSDPSITSSMGDRGDSVPALDMVFSDSISSLDSTHAVLAYAGVRYTQLPGRPSAMPTSINGRVYLPLGDSLAICDSIIARVPGGVPDSLVARYTVLPARATTHLSRLAGARWALGLSDGRVLAGDTGSIDASDTIALDNDAYVSGLAALAGEQDRFVCAQGSGLLSVVNITGPQIDTVRLNGIPPYAIVTGDLDNDAENEIVVTDSRHGVWCFNRDLTLAQGWERSPVDWASVYTYRETRSDTARAIAPENLSAPSLADLNRDGHLDIVLGGTNGLYALNYKGVLLYGWPSYLDNRFWYWRQSVGVSPVVAVDQADQPLVLFATPSGEHETYSFFRIDSVHADRYMVFFTRANGDPDSAGSISAADLAGMLGDSLYFDPVTGKYLKIDSTDVDHANARDVKVFYTRTDGSIDSVGGLKPELVDTLMVYGDSLIPDFILPGGLIDARDVKAARPGFVTTLGNVGAERQSYWPLTTGSAPATAPLICDFDGNGAPDLFAISRTGWIYRWEIARAAAPEAQAWPQVGYDNGRSFAYLGAAPAAVEDASSPLKFFSYPNPTAGAKSVQFRYKFAGPARNVRLDIYTYTGFHVYSWKAPRSLYETNWRDWSELPAEVSLKNYGPGVYRCRMEAEISVNGAKYKSYHKYWKMAVVK